MKRHGATFCTLTCLILITSWQSLSPGPAYNQLTNMVAIPLTRPLSLHHIFRVEIQNGPCSLLVDTGDDRTIVRDNRPQHFNIECADAIGLLIDGFPRIEALLSIGALIELRTDTLYVETIS